MSRTRQSDNSRLPESALIVVGNDFRLAHPKPLKAKRGASKLCETVLDFGGQLHMNSGVSIVKAIPVLEVADVAASIKWYREMLEFSADPFPESPPHQFAILRPGQTELMLRCGSPKTLAEQRQYKWDVYLRLGGGQIRQLFAELTSRGVVSRRLERMFYGLAEFEIKDPDGYTLCLAEELEDSQDLPTPQL